MKRNWDLIRRILLKLEEKAVPEDFLMSDQIQGLIVQLSLTILSYCIKQA